MILRASGPSRKREGPDFEDAALDDFTFQERKTMADTTHMLYRAFMNDDPIRDLKRNVKIAANGVCEECREYCGIENLQAHHLGILASEIEEIIYNRIGLSYEDRKIKYDKENPLHQLTRAMSLEIHLNGLPDRPFRFQPLCRKCHARHRTKKN